MLRALFRTILSILVLLSVGAGRAENIDPLDSGQHYAWGENVGWLNFEPQGDGGPGVQVHDEYLEGYIWGENIGWISLNCLNNDICTEVDFGVLNNGEGVLSGFAWNENTGWISFSCESTQACDTTRWGVTINTGTGRFEGYAVCSTFFVIHPVLKPVAIPYTFQITHHSVCISINRFTHTDIP